MRKKIDWTPEMVAKLVEGRAEGKSWVTIGKSVNVSAFFVMIKAEELGMSSGRLPQECKAESEIRWRQFEQGLTNLKQYVDRMGTIYMPYSHHENGQHLKVWCDYQRRNQNGLSAAKKKALEQVPGWTWDLPKPRVRVRSGVTLESAKAEIDNVMGYGGLGIFNTKTKNALLMNGIYKLSDVLDKTETELTGLDFIGFYALKHIKETLASAGLSLKQKDDLRVMQQTSAFAAE